jgi:hypothetical protein
MQQRGTDFPQKKLEDLLVGSTLLRTFIALNTLTFPVPCQCLQRLQRSLTELKRDLKNVKTSAKSARVAEQEFNQYEIHSFESQIACVNTVSKRNEHSF